MRIDFDLHDLPGLMLLGGVWLVTYVVMLAGIMRHLLIQRRLERTYRLRLAHWRATVDSA